MERNLATETVEGEIGVVIDYTPGKTPAVNVLQAAMLMVEALDKLDSVLLSSVDTSLEPVSVLNDVQHSSLKMLLARVLRNVPDDAIRTLDWKKWIGTILVDGKYKLLQHLGDDAPEIGIALKQLESNYKAPPGQLLDFHPPSVGEVIDALESFAKARSAVSGHKVIVETELGDIVIPDIATSVPDVELLVPTQEIVNRGTELFKVKSPDMLGSAQWSVQRNGRSVRVDILHKSWLEAYHRREMAILPGDSLKCNFEETVRYDASGTEVERHLAIIEVLEIISPPRQHKLLY